MLGRFARAVTSDDDRTDHGLPIAGIDDDDEPDAPSDTHVREASGLATPIGPVQHDDKEAAELFGPEDPDEPDDTAIEEGGDVDFYKIVCGTTLLHAYHARGNTTQRNTRRAVT